jgi:hypothetical protein
MRLPIGLVHRSVAGRRKSDIDGGDAYYDATWAQWPQAAYPGGAHTVWAYVDSWAPPNPAGSVQEAREDNNLSRR